MVKTKKYGVTLRGVVQKAGTLLSLPAAEEERLVKDGWCSYVEVWPAGAKDYSHADPDTAAPEETGETGPDTSEPEESAKTGPDTAAAEDVEETGPQTDAPEEEQPKRTRSRKK